MIEEHARISILIAENKANWCEVDEEHIKLTYPSVYNLMLPDTKYWLCNESNKNIIVIKTSDHNIKYIDVYLQNFRYVLYKKNYCSEIHPADIIIRNCLIYNGTKDIEDIDVFIAISKEHLRSIYPDIKPYNTMVIDPNLN